MELCTAFSDSYLEESNNSFVVQLLILSQMLVLTKNTNKIVANNSNFIISIIITETDKCINIYEVTLDLYFVVGKHLLILCAACAIFNQNDDGTTFCTILLPKDRHYPPLLFIIVM